MDPLGLLTPDGARASFTEQAQALQAGGADFALIETMSALEEVQAAVEGAREAGLPAVVTMSFDTHFRTMMGIKPVNALETLAGWGVTVVGANCGNGPAEIERVMTEMSQAKPEGVVLMAKSNAGMPRWKDDRITYGGTPGNHGGLRAAHEGARRTHHRRLLRQHAGTHRGDACGTGSGRLTGRVRRAR